MTDNREHQPAAAGSGLVTVAAVLGLAMAGLAYAGWIRIERLEAELAAHPPVAIVNYAVVATEVTRRNGNIDEALGNVRAAVARLRDAGYLVLDAEHVVATPRDLVLDPKTLIGELTRPPVPPDLPPGLAPRRVGE